MRGRKAVEAAEPLSMVPCGGAAKLATRGDPD